MSKRADGFWWVKRLHGGETVVEVRPAKPGSQGQAVDWMGSGVPWALEDAERAIAEWGLWLGKSPEATAAEVVANMHGLTTVPWEWKPVDPEVLRRLPKGMRASVDLDDGVWRCEKGHESTITGPCTSCGGEMRRVGDR